MDVEFIHYERFYLLLRDKFIKELPEEAVERTYSISSEQIWEAEIDGKAIATEKFSGLRTTSPTYLYRRYSELKSPSGNVDDLAMLKALKYIGIKPPDGKYNWDDYNEAPKEKAKILWEEFKKLYFSQVLESEKSQSDDEIVLKWEMSPWPVRDEYLAIASKLFPQVDPLALSPESKIRLGELLVWEFYHSRIHARLHHLYLNVIDPCVIEKYFNIDNFLKCHSRPIRNFHIFNGRFRRSDVVVAFNVLYDELFSNDYLKIIDNILDSQDDDVLLTDDEAIILFDYVVALTDDYRGVGDLINRRDRKEFRLKYYPVLLAYAHLPTFYRRQEMIVYVGMLGRFDVSIFYVEKQPRIVTE